MKIGIHQPQYMPWLGYLDKIHKADKFVFLDDVQYKKREFQNRNKIRTSHGSMWLTVPVLVKGKYYQEINKVMINNSTDWEVQHIKAIKHSYSSAIYFKKYFPYFEELLLKKCEYLFELNMAVIELLLKIFKIDTPYIFSSKLNIKTEKTERLIDICRKLKTDEYLSGQGAKEYIEESKFASEGIKLTYQEFNHPEYKQNFKGFISHLSVIDYLFNCGNNFFSD